MTEKNTVGSVCSAFSVVDFKRRRAGLLLHLLSFTCWCSSRLFVARRAGIIAGPCRNPFIVLVVAARTPCALARRAPAARGGEARQSSTARHSRPASSARSHSGHAAPRAAWSLDCDPRCFTGSFRAVDSRIAASSWRWRHPTSWRVSSTSTCGAPANQAWTSSSTPIVSACGSKCWWNRGASVAAQKLAEMDVDLVIAALAQHARVFDRAARIARCADGRRRDGRGPRTWTMGSVATSAATWSWPGAPTRGTPSSPC